MGRGVRPTSLEAIRRLAPETPLVFASTNKVYGDSPNELPLKELEKRWEYARPDLLALDCISTR